ncbi:MAG: hypothetical protein RBS39_08770 [Phycisphaerales bacterium]|jgi:hypothetical protein|nr:hypothetical protein [Phycisphaerales bacterium]
MDGIMNAQVLRNGFIALAAMAGAASAGITGPTALWIEATNANGTGMLAIDLTDGFFQPDGTFIWFNFVPQNIIDTNNNQVIGQLRQGSLSASNTSPLGLSFVVQAGAVDTVFTFTTATVQIPGGYLNPDARASAGLTLTDSNGNGATLTGLQTGGNYHTAFYNNASSEFSNLVQGPLVVVNPNGSTNANEDFPGPVGYATIPGLVNDISAQFSFRLTANDQASGTSVFVVVPTPASIALLGISGLALTTRRR